MLFRSFAHWLLILFGSVLLAALAVVVVRLGYLGPGAVALLDSLWLPILDLYDREKAILAPAWQTVGFAGSVLLGVWTLYEGWHYAERNLPKRVEEASKRWAKHIRDVRPDDIRALQDHFVDMEADPEPSLFIRWLSRIHDRSQWAIASCQEQVGRRSNDFRILTAGRVSCRAQLITAHLEHGAHLSRQRRGDEAMKQFAEALRLNTSEPDALELAGRQALALKQTSVALSHFEKLEAVSATRANLERQSRAMRFQAETLKRGAPAELMKARNVLKAAIAILRQPNTLHDSVKSRELCLAHGQLADIQTIRNTLHSARSAYDQAFALLNRLDGSGRSDLGKWLKEIESRLAQAERDRDSDKEKDEDRPDDDSSPSYSP